MQNPDKAAASGSSGSESGSESDSESDEDVKPTTAAKKAAPAPAPVAAAGAKYGRSFFAKGPDDSDSDDSDDDVDLDESESNEDDDSDEDGASRWKLQKKDTKEPAAAGKKKKEPKEVKVKGPKEDKLVEKAVVKEMTAEQVDKKLAELLAGRGKRGTDKQEQIEQLEFLLQFAKSDAQLSSILMNVVSAQFDATPTVATHMPANLWKGKFPPFNILLLIFLIYYYYYDNHKLI